MWVWLKPLLNSRLIFIFPLGALWLWGSRGIFTKAGIFPLTTAEFDRFLSISDSERIVFDPSNLHFISGLIALLPLIYILVSYLALSDLCKNFAFRYLIAFFISSTLFFYAAPGEAHEKLARYSFSCLCLLLIYPAKISLLRIWILVNSLGFLALFWPELRSIFLWTLFALVMKEIFVFFFIHKLRPEHFDFKNQMRSSSFKLLSAFMVSIWILSIRPPFDSHAISSIWWVSLMAASFCVFLAFREPWQSKRWIGLATFSLGLLLFSGLDFAVSLAGVLLFIELLQSFDEISSSNWFQKSRRIIVSMILIAALSMMTLAALRYDNKRSFDISWNMVLNQITKDQTSNIAIMGDALEFLSRFYSGDIIQNPIQILEGSEEKMQAWMREEKISKWIVDVDYLKKYWRNLIQEGADPEQINASVLSRLSLYDGQEVSTKTLKIAPIKIYESFPLKSSSFIIVQEKQR